MQSVRTVRFHLETSRRGEEIESEQKQTSVSLGMGEGRGTLRSDGNVRSHGGGVLTGDAPATTHQLGGFTHERGARVKYAQCVLFH